jgi:hypothetical protein
MNMNLFATGLGYSLPTETKIEILMALSLTAIALLALLPCIIYVDAKKRGHRPTCRDAIRFEIFLLKSGIIYLARTFLLVIVMVLPLIAIGMSTEMSMISATVIEALLSGRVLSPLPAGVHILITISLLSLFVIVVLSYFFFFDKYGAVYKLVPMYFVRNDIKELLSEHTDILIALTAGFSMYALVIVGIFVTLAGAPLPLPTGIAFVIITFLLVEVLYNKRYDNAIKLIERITKEKLQTEK